MPFTARRLSTNALYQGVNKVAHGFQVGDVLRYNGTDFVKAQADTEPHSEVVGIVSALSGADAFYITQEGFVSDITTSPVNPGGAYVAGTLYYLSPSTAGALTATKPTTVGTVELPCFIAYTATSGFFFASVGTLIESGALFSWTVRNVNTVLTVNNGYISSSGGTINFTLPAAFAVGDIIRVANLAGQFSVIVPGGVTVNFGTSVAGTSLTSTNIGDAIEFVGVVANTTYQAVSAIGTITVV